MRGRGRSDAHHATRDCPFWQGGRWDGKIVKHHMNFERKRASGRVARVPGSRGERAQSESTGRCQVLVRAGGEVESRPSSVLRLR